MSPPTWLARSSGDSGCRKDADLPGAGRAQHPRARLAGGAGGRHIVDQHHRQSSERRAARALPRRARVASGRARPSANAPATLVRRSAACRPACGLVHRPRRNACRTGSPRCSASSAAWLNPRRRRRHPVQRHGNHDVGAVEDAAARFAHQRGEGPRQRPSLVVLEGVDDVAEAALVRTGGGLGAARRRGEAMDGRPACPAHGACRGLVERTTARGAVGRDDDADEGVEDAREGARGLRRPGRASRGGRRCPRAARCRRTRGLPARRRGRRT